MSKILIVEDEGILAYHLQIMLEQLGHSVVGVADNAADALEICPGEKPDIVFMDLLLKGKVSGKKLAMSSCMKNGCKIIFMTGSSVSDETLKGIEEYPLLRKPFDEAQVMSALEQVLAK
jgi:CheY-like chemotaxis protein